MLKANNLTKIYSKNGHSFTALDDVTIKIEKGDFVAVTGSSGSGKSTLLHTLGGLIRPNKGQVLYKGKDVYAFNKTEANNYRKKCVGFVFQQFHLMPYLTVFENIKIAGGDSGNQINTIENLLKKCSLFALRQKYPSELSVGEKQRAAFIRAIISNPDILLADEPTGNLDPENSKIVMLLIEDFHKNGGTVLLVTHQSEVSDCVTQSIKLRAGKRF